MAGIETAHQRYNRDVAVTIGMLTIFLITRFIVPPIVLHHISLQEYGIWSYAFILIGYLGMSVFGISNVYVRYSAVDHAKGDIESINRLASTGFFTMLGMSCILLPILWLGVPAFLEMLNVTPQLMDTAFWVVLGTAFVFLIDLTWGFYGAILQGIQKISIERVIATFSYVLETFLVILFLWMGWGIYSLMWAFVIKTFTAIIGWAIACKYYLPSFQISPKYFDKNSLKLFLHFGGIVQLSGLLGVINRSLEKFIAGLTMGAATTALYELGEKFPLAAHNFPSAFNTVLLPASAHLHAGEEHEEVRNLYLQSSSSMHLLAGVLFAFMWAWAQPLMVFWLGDLSAYIPAIEILVFFSVAYHFDVLTGPASALYRGMNFPARELIYAILRFALTVGGTIWMMSIYGVGIKAINWGVAGGMIISSIGYILYSNHFLKISQLKYFKEVFWQGFLPYLIAWGTAVIVQTLYPIEPDSRKDAFFLLLMGGIPYSLICLGILYLKRRSARA